jgi:DNA-damage-inducible protein J
MPDFVNVVLLGIIKALLNFVRNAGALSSACHERGFQAHGAWFRTKVLEALTDTRPDLSDDDVEAHFVKRRVAARLKAGAPES